jgi:Kef-type K+ transport system membrane component KefB
VGHSDILLTIALVLVAAKLGGRAAQRLGLPVVFGKLLVGLALGPALLGVIEADETLSALGELGIILLMFIAGLETDLAQMRKVGLPAFLAACGGVALPMAGGIGLGLAFDLGLAEAFFLGTILTATSVGITAQTLSELGRLKSREGSAILAAAVIDDVLGIIVLSLVLGFSGGGDPVVPIIKITAFLPLALVLGSIAVPFVINRIMHLEEGETRIAIVLGIALAFAWAAEHWGGLAAITGAYLAGLLVARTAISDHATESITRIGDALFIPVFFVVVGLQMNASALQETPLFALLLVVVAIGTKVAGAMGGALVGGFSRQDATRVGYGMVSRGEVALVVAVVGFNEGLVSDATFSAAILMTLATTLASPLLLKWSYRERSGARVDEAEAARNPVQAGGSLLLAEQAEAAPLP